MELSPLFLSYPWVWLFVALVFGVFLAGHFLPRYGYILFILGALGLTGLIIFVILYDGNYLDAAFVALICLLPLFAFFALPRRENKTEESAS